MNEKRIRVQDYQLLETVLLCWDDFNQGIFERLRGTIQSESMPNVLECTLVEALLSWKANDFELSLTEEESHIEYPRI